MRKIFKISVFVFAIVLATVACKPIEEQVEIYGCEMESLESVNLGAGRLTFGTILTLDAKNASCSDITLSKLDAKVYTRSGKNVATLQYKHRKGAVRPTLHHRSEESVNVPLSVSFDNPLSALTLAAMTLDDYASKGYTVSYDCTLRAGLMAKRFRETNVPIDNLVKMLDK